MIFSWPIIIEKAIICPLDYYGYPWSTNEFGPLMGFLNISLFMWLLSLTFMLVYDRVRKDFLRVREAKETALRVVNKVCRFFFGREFESHSETLIRLGVAWQFFPPYSVLCRRREGQWGMSFQEFVLLAMVNWGASIFWTLVGFLNLSVLKLVLALFHWLMH